MSAQEISPQSPQLPRSLERLSIAGEKIASYLRWAAGTGPTKAAPAQLYGKSLKTGEIVTSTVQNRDNLPPSTDASGSWVDPSYLGDNAEIILASTQVLLEEIR